MKFVSLSLVLFLALMAAACGLFNRAEGLGTQGRPVTPEAPAVFEDNPAASLPPGAAVPASAEPSATLPSPETPTLVPPTLAPPTATIAPTPTTAPNPMSIPALRQGSYPGSEITIEQTLDPGANYSRYIASYQSEGLKIYALLTVPQGKQPAGGWPGIVFNHGYIPPAQYRTTERYIAYVDWLARSGYVVFRIDYRGHDRSEGQARGAYGDPGYTVDVLNASASLRQSPLVDPERLGMWGHSMGGFLTLRAMVIDPHIRAGVIWSGVVASYPDLISKWHRNQPTPTPFPGARSWRGSWINQYGSPDQNPDFWSSISANSFLGDLSGPLQLHHSLDDPEVPVEFSETLDQQVQAAGKTAELYTYKGDNHNLSNSFSQAMTRTVQFFDRYLKAAP